jgi:uncharacterized repeat protein (TIGR01451 family)
MNRVLQALRACSPATRLGAGLLAAVLAVTCMTGQAFAQENPDPSLQGVSRSQIQANGLPSALITSARGVNQVGAIQIPRSGFDIINNGTVGTVLLRGVRLFPNPADCNTLQDDAFFLVTVAGRPGDADGDGAFSRNTGLCAARRNNLPSPSPKINDGVNANGIIDLGLLTFGENVRIRLDRNCDGKADIVFSLSNDPATPAVLRVESDDLTGHGGQTLGGEGTAWEAAVFPANFYDGAPCPDPASITGHYIMRIPNFSSFFTAPGLNPTDFGFVITAGSDDDGLEEDLIQGEVHKPEVRLSITKTPDLALCPAEEGNWTIHVSNDGNVTLSNLVVTDILPAGVTFVSVVSGGVTASGTTTLTFSPFDLAQCETKDIVIRVRADDNCSGSGVNSASVAGVFRTLCDLVTPGQLSDQPVTAGPATANFTCKAKPCVTITLDTLAPQCPDTPVTVTGKAVNCGNGPERIFVRVGNGAETDLGIVQPGDANGVNFQLSAGNLDCKIGQATYTVNARATADCPPEGTDSKQVTIQCLTAPCVSLSLDALPAQCPGSPVTVTGKATNCGSVAGHIFVRIGNGTEVDLGVVQPGAANAASFQLPAGNLVCEAGSATFTVNARAPGDCPPAATDSKQVTIQCLTAPCVSLSLDALPAQCPGTPVTVTGKATNCGSAAAHIFVQLGNGPETDLGVVQPGAANAASFQLAAGNLVCENGSATYTVNARSPGDCPPAGTDSKQVTIQCLVAPCVTLTLNPLEPRCQGADVTVSGRVVNCSSAAERIFVRLGAGAEVDLGIVQPGAANGLNFQLPAGALVCVKGSALYTVTARAVGDCEPAATDVKEVTLTCQVPQIQISKTGPSTVNNGATISYVITVTNPSTTVDLEGVVVTDQLCSYVKDPRNFGGTCVAGAPTIGATITWPSFNLAHNSSCTITFDVTADVTVGGATCPGTFSCPNLVHVYGFCLGSQGQSRVDADGSFTTAITCVGEACPRTPGFWAAQCAQRPNGSTKFTALEVTTIAECIDDRSAFFNWPQGTDFDLFCRNINPTTPMDVRKQAKRQFAALLANYCTDFLNMQPSRGGTIFLDPATPVHCDGLKATTIGELIDEVDALLAALQGQSLNDPEVKAKYAAIISCIDAINNGVSIPTAPGCEETSGSSSDDAGAVDGSSSVELYRPMPNPFSNMTSFAYSVGGEGSAGVDITVFDVAGRQIRKLVSGPQTAGVHTVSWDGRSDQGTQVTRGMYFVRTVIAGVKAATNRVLYVTDAR